MVYAHCKQRAASAADGPISWLPGGVFGCRLPVLHRLVQDGTEGCWGCGGIWTYSFEDLQFSESEKNCVICGTTCLVEMLAVTNMKLCLLWLLTYITSSRMPICLMMLPVFWFGGILIVSWACLNASLVTCPLGFYLAYFSAGAAGFFMPPLENSGHSLPRFFLQVAFFFCHPANNVEALKGRSSEFHYELTCTF